MPSAHHNYQSAKLGLSDGGFLCPFPDPHSAFVSKASGKDHDKVDQGPNTQAADGEDLRYTGAYFADIKAVCAKDSHKKTEQKSGKYPFVSSRCDGRHCHSSYSGPVLLYCSTRWTTHRGLVDLFTACCAIDHCGHRPSSVQNILQQHCNSA
jgi:hypothetical protein